MRTSKTRRITIETESVLIIRQRSCNRRWCPKCYRVTEMVGFAQASALTGVPQPHLRECAQAEKWHVIETGYNSPMICLDSLLIGVQLDARAMKTVFTEEEDR
jgi:hypothetical protein